MLWNRPLKKRLFVSSHGYSNVFYSWITQCLIPVLPQKSVLFMDNVSFHKREDILQAIEKAGHQVEFLPPYSPDLNPIEHKWAQAKRKKRETGFELIPYFLFICNQN